MKTTFLNNRQYDVQSGDGGGLPPSLADLDNPDYKPPVNLVDEAAKQAALEKEQADKASADAQAALELEGKNPDGSLKEGWTEVDGKLVAPVAADADMDETPEPEGTAEEFFADVNKLHGTEIKVEYPDGVDPLSPQGVYERDKVIMDVAVSNFEAYLKKKDPRSYAYMLHRDAGGDDESFLGGNNKTFTLPEYLEFKESADSQVAIYKRDLIQKGLDPEQAQMIIDKVIKDGQLFTKADGVYKATEQKQAAELKEIEQRNLAAEQEYNSNVNSFNQKLTSAVTDGKEMKFVIPDTEKAKFLEFVRGKVEWDAQSKQFLLVQKVEDLGKQLESMYLLYKKGDLTSLIQRKADTQNVVRLRKVVDKSKQGGTGGVDDGKKPKFVALGDL